jgi:excisionase family DNA binding protein
MEWNDPGGIEQGCDALLTIPDAARRLGIGRRQLDRAISTGRIAVYDLGAWPRLRWREVLAWIEGMRRATGDRLANTGDERERV